MPRDASCSSSERRGGKKTNMSTEGTSHVCSLLFVYLAFHIYWLHLPFSYFRFFGATVYWRRPSLCTYTCVIFTFFALYTNCVSSSLLVFSFTYTWYLYSFHTSSVPEWLLLVGGLRCTPMSSLRSFLPYSMCFFFTSCLSHLLVIFTLVILPPFLCGYCLLVAFTVHLSFRYLSSFHMSIYFRRHSVSRGRICKYAGRPTAVYPVLRVSVCVSR